MFQKNKTKIKFKRIINKRKNKLNWNKKSETKMCELREEWKAEEEGVVFWLSKNVRQTKRMGRSQQAWLLLVFELVRFREEWFWRTSKNKQIKNFSRYSFRSFTTKSTCLKPVSSCLSLSPKMVYEIERLRKRNKYFKLRLFSHLCWFDLGVVEG